MSDLERVFGLHAVQALLDRHPKRIKRLLLQAGRLNERQQALLALAERQGVALQRVAGDELFGGDIDFAAIAQDMRGRRAKLRQRANRRGGRAFGAVLEPAAEEHERGVA